MSQESKTPRTDAEASDAANYAPIEKGWYVHVDFARQLERELAAVTAELADDDALRERMSDILKRTAIALRGPEPPLTAWSWHDLPELAEAAKASALEEAARMCEMAADAYQKEAPHASASHGLRSAAKSIRDRRAG